MPIFYTDTGSLGVLQVSGSAQISGSGSGILSVIGNSGGLFRVSDYSSNSNLFEIISSSVNVFIIDEDTNAVFNNNVIVSGSITGSLLGTASFSSFAATSSFALNAGGGSGFPFSGSALITGSIILTSGSGFPSITASEALTAGDFVNIFSGGVRRASNDDLTKQAHGFVTSSYSSTNQVVVFYSGLNTSLSGLTAGSKYYLGTAGAETNIPVTAAGKLSQEIGVAVSTTAMLVNFGTAIIT